MSCTRANDELTRRAVEIIRRLPREAEYTSQTLSG